jgi:hypothetical protein
MIVRLEISQRDDASATSWQLERCQVQRGWSMEDVRMPTLLRPIRFVTLEAAIRYAKKATFAHLEAKRHKRMPDRIDWHIVHEGRTVPCPACHQPLYQKAKLGRFGTSLDLTEWGCPRCKNTIHTNLSVDVPTSQIVTNPSPSTPHL